MKRINPLEKCPKEKMNDFSCSCILIYASLNTNCYNAILFYI